MNMNQPAQLDPDATLWTAIDVAAFLRVSRSWVYHRAESGELPYLRVGGLLRFDPEAIRNFARGELRDEQRPKRLPLSQRAVRMGR
jgi:excisionase family DNA binding protein